MVTLEKFSEIVSSCENSTVGKHLPNALYVHTDALTHLDHILRDYERQARKLVDNTARATIVKFSIDRPKISYLYYPDFDRDPHPQLHQSIVVDLIEEQVSVRQYHNSHNPPILHRKETFVSPDYPLYETFAQLTQEEVALGLLDNSRHIGTLQEWTRLLLQQGISFEDHHTACPVDSSLAKKSTVLIERHKAALKRSELSRPVRVALEAGIFKDRDSFFDYGCGHGEDVRCIGEAGYRSAGWDPFYRPDAKLESADIVNLGYIINVIEDLVERRQTLIDAWELTQKVLIVSAQVLVDDRRRGLIAYGDGIVTNRNTFQKYYEQEELKLYIDQVLEVDSIPAGLGMYVVFRHEAEAESFRASRLYSSLITPRIQAQVRNFEDYQDLLTPLMDFYTKRGRLPVKGELATEAEIKAEFRSYQRAFKLVLQATDRDEWDAIVDKRREDLLVYLALGKFSGRPTIRKLAPEIKADVKALFGSYKQACTVADLLLLQVGDMNKIAQLCRESKVGKHLNDAIAVHVSALEKLPPLLRLYEGCASRNFYRLENANIIKLYYHKPKITYLVYPEFDTQAHPTLRATMEVDLHNLSVTYHDISDETNPLILHQKDALVAPDYPSYKQFVRLTKKEQKSGLLKNKDAIRRLHGWLRCLREHEVKIEGHKLSTK
ncbi:DNA phosphorothioation-associated putative methyltransferase [Waterburya agarophytonicola K14]|uniref:DNA phosphorothioation-associated putative methyltransferase n=1 Tax=Waterburya agarophytonicola KI4 TaxID=2874699 RepID=A0A964BPV4_9CYAN|nr:DNA phosphorothioation-associated putative methyltransferase [Waterburya agarophytonicola]MCC0176616.1 DNA phosphorothioation-associated putative methyltransferase [Waterburya agarophytonicola KI4]